MSSKVGNKENSFVEFEEEEAMKRAYRAADGMRIEGRHIVVDVENFDGTLPFRP